jgi:hypothetical protein
MPTTVRSSLFMNFWQRYHRFLVNRTRSPIESVISSRSNTLDFTACSSGNRFSTPSFPTMTAFSQANEAQFYVSMSHARYAMAVFTDSQVALRDPATRPSK